MNNFTYPSVRKVKQWFTKCNNVTLAAAGLLNILSGSGNFGKFDEHAGNMEFNIQNEVYVQLHA
jgi:hypothetical protein